jgi:LPS-assembly protein
MMRRRYLPHGAALAAVLAGAAFAALAQTRPSAEAAAGAFPIPVLPEPLPGPPAVPAPIADPTFAAPPPMAPTPPIAPVGPEPAGPPAVALVADTIEVDREAGTVTAAGNVEVHYQGRVLTARRIVYSEADDSIRATGPLVLTDPEVGVVQAEAAALTADLAEGLIASARMLIAGEMQLAAAELRRIEGRYTVLHNTIASTCEVCPDDRAPFWAIRAERIIRDEEELQIHLRNAVLEVFGVPVLWLPYMRIPDGTVTRASGLLVPEFRQSQIYGLGFKLPYYQVLGPHADATIRPFVTQRGGTLVEGEFRRRFARGSLDVTGVVLPNDRLNGDDLRGTATVVGNYALAGGFLAEIDAAVVSDDDFLRQFDYSETDRLTSTARVVRTRAEDHFALGTVAFQSLRPEEDQGQVPFVFPELDYRRNWQDALMGGRAGLEANAAGILRENGRDVLRFGGSADWRRDWIAGPGIVAGAEAGAGLELYHVRDVAAEASREEARLAPWMLAEISWPLARATSAALHVVEPRATIAWSEAWGEEDVPNEDSTLPEFDETNLFALDRYPGRDRVETGFRANLGLTYARIDTAGWSMHTTFGRVLRFSDEDQFPEGTGLAGTRSDWVGSVELGLGAGFGALNRIRFDDDFTVRRNEFSVLYDRQDAGIAASWVFLAADDTNPDLGLQPESNEITLNARYRLLPNWQVRGQWRYDLADASTLRVGGGITYGNECAEVDLGVSRRSVTAGDVPPATSVVFAVRLVGLGAGATEQWPRRVCNG